MDSIKLWARNGEAVRQAIELGEMAHIETASEELTDEWFIEELGGVLSRSTL
jgi:hypothetical protein